MYLISQHDLNKQVDTFLVRFPKDGNSIDLFKKFSGYMYGFVLTGEIQFEIDNKSYVIQEGDSIYFNTRRNFKFENLNDGISEILCIFPNSKRWKLIKISKKWSVTSLIKKEIPIFVAIKCNSVSLSERINYK